MNTRLSSFLLPGLILLAVIFLVGLTWVNALYAAQNTGMDDFLTAWAGTRAFLTKGWSPYSAETTQEIQQLAYGRSALPDDAPGFFLFPLYSVLVFFPFALVGDFVTARALWMTLLEISLLGLLWAGISLSRWRISGWMAAILLFFTFFWYPGVRPVLSGDPVLLAAFFLALAYLAIRSDHDVLAGILLAFASLEPQVMLLPTLFIMIWAATQRRWVLVCSPLLTVALLVAAASLFIPDWAWQNAQQFAGYLNRCSGELGTPLPQQACLTTPGRVLTYWLPGVGKQLGLGLTISMIGMVLWEWRQAAGKEVRWFLWTAYLTQVAALLIGLDISIDSYISLLPGLILVLATWDERWGGVGRILIVLSIPLLAFGLWAGALNSARQQSPLNLDPVLVFLLPLFLLGGLYWVRWWAIRPPRLYVEILSRHLS